MDLWTVAAVVMLVVWAVATFAFTAPGWMQFLLSLGVFIVIWRQVVRSTPAPVEPPRDARAGADHTPRG
jgi:hypothetical protein